MKLYILAFLVLTAAVTVAGNERIIVVPRVKELIKKNVRFHKRDSEECIAIECGKEGDKCTPKGTICQEGTNCRNGTCSQSIAGDPCSEDDDCYGLFYCSDNDDKCVPYQKAGDVCYGECEDMYDTLYCSSDTKGVCRPKHKEIGDVCDYNYERYCPSDVSYCTATSSSQTGVCKELPSKAGDSCDTNYGCNKENDLYCSKDTNKCTQLPKDGESCYNSKCSTGYYCNMNTCAKKKGLNEECTNGACDNELVCSEGKCRKRNPKRGEYCGTNVKCADKNDICEGNVCTDRKGRCTYDNDCPNSLSYACHNGQCVGDFSISEGEECFHDEKDFNDFLSSSFQCKEGLCCIPENRSHENFKCRKVTTKLKDKKTCTNDSDCPIDSFCGCNNKDGIVQCIPYPVSSKKLKNKIVSMQEDFHECVVKHYDTWMQCYTILNEFYAYIGEEVFPYHSEYRCSDHSLFGAASTVTVSFMAVVAALLFVLF